MRHTADVAHGHEIRRVEGMEKGVAHVPQGKGRRSLWVLGELLTYKVPSQQTGGAYSLFEVTTQPGAGPPPHVNHREDESFYVLEGEFEFSNSEETLRMDAGSLLYVPKGKLHAHKNVGEGFGRLLVTQTPGGLYERFFEKVGKPADGDGQPLVVEDQADVERIMKVAATYGIEISPANIEKVWLRHTTKGVQQ